MSWLRGCLIDNQGSEAKQWKDILGFLESDSGFVESLVTVFESKELVKMQPSGISEGKDCTLQLEMKLYQMV